MEKFSFSIVAIISFVAAVNSQKTTTGNPKDFKVKTCLHSVGYSGA